MAATGLYCLAPWHMWVRDNSIKWRRIIHCVQLNALSMEQQPEYQGVLWLFKTTVNHMTWRRRVATVKWRRHVSCGYSQHSTGKHVWNQASSLTSTFFWTWVCFIPIYSWDLYHMLLVRFWFIHKALSNIFLFMIWIYMCVLRPVVAHSVGHTHCTCTSRSLRLAPQCRAFA